MKMPIIRKIISIGGSQGITIPKQWLEWIERTTGKRVTEVTVEVNDVLRIAPILEKEIVKLEAAPE
jgi:antitoxin component of MazEF toxin-antitoxin module